MNLGYHLKLGHTVQFSTHQEDRRGAMSLLFLMCFALALLALVMALDVAALYTIRGQMHSACESSVLAAALALTDDQQLIDDPHVRTHLIERARAEGRKYAVANNLITPAQHATSQIAAVDLFFEESSLLQGTPSSQPIPDLVQGVGYRRGSTGNGLHLVLPELFLFGPLDLSVRSMAQIDREIVGFRPQQSLNIPMVPMVVRSDPSGKPIELGSLDLWRHSRCVCLRWRRRTLPPQCRRRPSRNHTDNPVKHHPSGLYRSN